MVVTSASHDPSTAAVSLGQLQRRIRVALGQEPGDLLLSGAQVVNVFTCEVQPASVVIADGWIAGVGMYDWPAHERLDLTGQYLLPGLIDAHMHLESALLLPGELARLIVPHGTSATISDSHEVGNVLGIPGIDMLIAASDGLPFDLFFTASSCVPATRWEDAGAVLGPPEVRQLLRRPRVLGLAEMMDIPAVLMGRSVGAGEDRGSRGCSSGRGWARSRDDGPGPHGLRRSRHPFRSRIVHAGGSPRQGCTGHAGPGA
jgi:adenine deaminase